MNRWNDKQVAFLGDSITEGVAVTPDTTYWHLLEGKTGIHAHCFGVNGARFCDLYDQALRMQAEMGENVDAVFIFAGTNDYFGNTPLGKWYRLGNQTVAATRKPDGSNGRLELRKVRSFLFEENTFCGNINRVLSFLKENYPEAQIVLLTPIHRAYACFGNENIQFNELYANTIGFYLEDYTNLLKEAANIWSVELIDMNSVAGFFPLYDNSAALYFANLETDRIHPSTKGHERIAEVLACKMQTIPLFR